MFLCTKLCAALYAGKCQFIYCNQTAAQIADRCTIPILNLNVLVRIANVMMHAVEGNICQRVGMRLRLTESAGIRLPGLPGLPGSIHEDTVMDGHRQGKKANAYKYPLMFLK